MNIEQHCVSLELAKSLKMAGYPQKNCLFYYIEFEDHGEVETSAEDRTHLFFTEDMEPKKWVTHRGAWGDLDRGKYLDDIIAAPLASEIGEQLPYFDLAKTAEGFQAWTDDFDGQQSTARGKTEAECLGNLYLYLKKEELIT